MRLVQDLPSLDSGGGTARQPETLPGTSWGSPWQVDFAKTPVHRSHPVHSQATRHAVQEWEGYVVRVDPETFGARLLDVTAGASYDFEEAMIPLMEIAHGDRERVVVGSIFRWVIGYERSPDRSRRRFSEIVFRDLPVVTTADEQEGADWAREVVGRFGL